MINGNVSSEFISLCECARSCKFYPKLRLASGFTLTKSTRMVPLQDVQPHNVTSGRPYATAEVTILVREITKNRNFKRHFLENGWSYRREILHDNLEDQVQWHIIKPCSFLSHFKTFHHENSGRSVIALFNKASHGRAILIAETILLRLKWSISQLKSMFISRHFYLLGLVLYADLKTFR